ncbi:MAG: ROK family protein, partial [Pseudomonadota bacterium]|nr:ROK family protein [Pseudomonadota bacterium]
MRIGIDLGGTKTEGVVMDDAGRVLRRLRRPTPQRDGYRAVLENIAGLVEELESHTEETCRVGIGTPGAVDRRSGLLKNSNTVVLNGKPLQRDL